jgi:activator of 2-hydroxyglutaryl-CoA dehydratase
MSSSLSLGVDVGSTTAKVVLLRRTEQDVILEASAYCRHEARIAEALQNVLTEATAGYDDDDVSVVFTGSAGMGLAERIGLPFI